MANINIPGTLAYAIARATTLEEWERINKMAHDALEERIESLLKSVDSESGTVAERAILDEDEQVENLNMICTLVHEIVQIKRLATQLLH